MRALVTGACGFVGDFLARYLIEMGDEVLGTRLSEPVADAPYSTVTLDITDAGVLRRVISDFRPEVIYHLAGMAFVPEAETILWLLPIGLGLLASAIPALRTYRLNLVDKLFVN